MYQRILIPVDDSRSSYQALLEACRLIPDQKAVLKVVHMIDLAQITWSGSEFINTQEWQHSIKEAGRELLGKVEVFLKERNIVAEIELIVIEGYGLSVGEEILKAAKNWSADLLVMGTHGWGGIMHVLMGSVTESVLHHTTIPMLLVRTNDSMHEGKSFFDEN
jgi:nucleotide-binding universal stress UspA family protein